MTHTAVKTDAELHQAVLQELKWDPCVSETEVGVEVTKGIVTLTGTVSSYAKRWAAQDAAHRVNGVLDVANDIQVKVPGSLAHTDTEIAQAVRQALEWNALIPHERIRTTVVNGWVTFEGTVPFVTDRTAAVQAVRSLAGVKGITNALIVLGPTVNADAVQESIEQALERRAGREARRIKVEVHDGAVLLTGRVHNWNEKQAVLGAAGCAPGVHTVTDHLQIDPSI
jgi:osmotically-inducible protein OsmY